MSNLRIHTNPVNPLHDPAEDDCCPRCGGEECIMNPDYLVWEQREGECLPDWIQNDSRRHGLPAQQRAWDEETGAPPRYLPCPACAGLDNLANQQQKTPLVIQLEKSIAHERAKQNGDGQQPLAAWQRAWRIGFAPQMSCAGLRALRQGLLQDDKRLIQGATCSPPPLQGFLEWKLTAGDAIVYAAWIGEGIDTVGKAEQNFARVCHYADNALGEPAAVRYFLNQFDEWGRDEMRKEMIIEVELALAARGCA